MLLQRRPIYALGFRKASLRLLLGLAFIWLAGLAAAGKIPFLSTFAKFVERAYDQVEMAIISGANFKITGSHAGVTLAADGPSQMSLPDVAFFRAFTRVKPGNNFAQPPFGLGDVFSSSAVPRSMQLGRILASQVQQNELIVADLHDRSDGLIGILGRLCLSVVHFKNVARDAVRTIGGLLVHVHKHNIDIDHDTHSLWLQPTTPRLTNSG